MALVPEFPSGTGFFETLLTRNGEIAELHRHMRRALRTSKALKIAIPSEDEIRYEIKRVLSEYEFQQGRLRLTFSEDGYAVSHSEYLSLKGAARLTFTTKSSDADGEQWKTYPYDHRLAITMQAQAQGFDDALVFNKSNHVTETGLSNIALMINGDWVTPPIGSGILPGTMRALAIERSGVAVQDIHISVIPEVRGAILLSSLKIAQPVSHIGDFELENGEAVAALTQDIASKVEFFSIG